MTLGACIPAQAQKKPMNIVYIMSDDHSYQTISAYDNRFINTPNIDWIANHGMKFQESFVANSLSGPSRACMLTGKHSHANGFTDLLEQYQVDHCVFGHLHDKASFQKVPSHWGHTQLHLVSADAANFMMKEIP